MVTKYPNGIAPNGEKKLGQKSHAWVPLSKRITLLKDPKCYQCIVFLYTWSSLGSPSKKIFLDEVELLSPVAH